MEKAYDHGVRSDMDARSPREMAVAQYLNNLCMSTASKDISVFITADVEVQATDMRVLTIDIELDNAKYVANYIIDAYAQHIAVVMKDNRRFSPAWEGWVMSNKRQVDDCLMPGNNLAYQSFARKFFLHDLVPPPPP